MDDKKNLPTKEPVKYATPMQRLWAWVGVVYMVALVLLTTYALSHGRYLQGIGSLMVSPALDWAAQPFCATVRAWAKAVWPPVC